MGGLFIPEAFVTASRQYVAQANNWSLEELQLEVEVSDPGGPPPQIDDRSFPVVGKESDQETCMIDKRSTDRTANSLMDRWQDKQCY